MWELGGEAAVAVMGPAGSCSVSFITCVANSVVRFAAMQVFENSFDRQGLTLGGVRDLKTLCCGKPQIEMFIYTFLVKTWVSRSLETSHITDAELQSPGLWSRSISAICKDLPFRLIIILLT